MKKQQIAAAACLVAGAIGFAAVYSTQKPGKDEIPTEISQTSSIVEPTEKKTPQKTTEKVDSETKMGQEESAAGQQENQQPTEKQLHFVPENVTTWPVKGDVLLPFTMDKTVYFPSLDQYQYNRGMVILANEGDAVCSVTEGRIIDIYDSAETGCTVVQDLGDGYTATYGQLANLTCSEGDVLEAGETLGIVGESGSGKSTLAKMITRLTDITDGTLKFQGKDITKLKDYKRALNIGCLYQNPLRGTAPTLTIEENLALAYTRKASPSFFALNKKDSAYFREVLSTLGMGIEDRMKTKIGLLSGGQRQAASLLMATIAEPELLLLDEHTAALDPGAAEKVMALTKKIVEENKITTLMITHDMEYALEYGSRTIMLDSGKIVMDLTGKEREEMTTGKLAELFYGKAHKKG